MLKNDVKELLDYCSQQISYLKTETIISKVIVKNILENLRSSLEYCAQYINKEKLLQNSRVYFPYGKTEEYFAKSINKNNFSRLRQEFPNIFDRIENLQPHKCADNWLIIMCEATNEAKHNNALGIDTNIEKEKVMTELLIPGIEFTEGKKNYNNVNIKMTGCYFNGQSIDDFHISNGNVNTIKKGNISPVYSFEIIENKTFILNNYSCDLFNLLEKSHSKIEEFSLDIFD